MTTHLTLLLQGRGEKTRLALIHNETSINLFGSAVKFEIYVLEALMYIEAKEEEHDLNYLSRGRG